MSDTGFESQSLAELARIELLQGILPEAESAERRRFLYDSFGTPKDRWVDKARTAYAAMSEVSGFVASVGDELSCELDIREHADLYAAVGGFDPNEITHGLSAWWSPSATWFQSGTALANGAGLSEPAFSDFSVMSRLLLDAGAHNLATFFSTVAQGGLRLLSSDARPPWRRLRREFAFVAEVARRRALLFRDGPDEDGRYLHEEPVALSDILATITRSRWSWPTRARAER